MKYLPEKEALPFIEAAAKEAAHSLCLNRKCGTVIVKDGGILGKGYNAPPLDDLKHRTCLDVYEYPHKKNFDRTCCIHAEWRAIMDALRYHPDSLQGSRLYFTSVDERGEPQKSGRPFCTVCSRLALDSGIAEFVLWHKDGIAAYDTDEYNRISYHYVPETA